MRDQYAGDVSDLIKFSLLRALAGNDKKLGVAWYYVPGRDGRPDGRHIEHRNEAVWKGLDRSVHDALVSLRERSVASLEQLPVWPKGTVFHREPVERRNRPAWAARMVDVLKDVSLVFADPDNGVGEPTEKYATIEELKELVKPRRPLVFISFPHRSTSHVKQIAALHAMLQTAGFSSVHTLATSVRVGSPPVPRSRWFTVCGADRVLAARVSGFARRLAAIPTVKASLHHAEASSRTCGLPDSAAPDREAKGAASPRTTTCTLGVRVVDIDEALRLRATRGERAFRCIRCGQPVVAHQSGADGIAHFEHGKRNPACGRQFTSTIGIKGASCDD